jgi:protein gp37
MGDRSGIEWTDATWNAVTGCTEVSPGCDHCYARTLAHGKLNDVYGKRLPVVDTPENRADTFAVRTWPERVNQPSRWRTARMIFVNSMSDFFHADIPEHFSYAMLKEMLEVDRHTYQVLTKRPGRALRFYRHNARHLPNGFPPHIWIGASVENQDNAFRVDQLRQVPAAVRFLSCEPLLGPLTLDLTGIHWLIAGGESGPGHRPMQADWVRSLRDQCQEQGVAFHFKQWGGRTPKAGGRELDSRTWDEWPRTTPDSEQNQAEPPK